VQVFFNTLMWKSRRFFRPHTYIGGIHARDADAHDRSRKAHGKKDSGLCITPGADSPGHPNTGWWDEGTCLNRQDVNSKSGPPRKASRTAAAVFDDLLGIRLT